MTYRIVEDEHPYHTVEQEVHDLDHAVWVAKHHIIKRLKNDPNKTYIVEIQEITLGSPVIKKVSGSLNIKVINC